MRFLLKLMLSLFILIIMGNVIYASTKITIKAQEFKKQDGIPIYVNGDLVESKIEPLIKEGRTFIPIRPVAEAMGARVTWNEESKTTIISTPDTIIGLKVDCIIMSVKKSETRSNSNSKQDEVTLEQAPRVIDGSTYIPIRPMVEALGAKSTWDAANKAIYIYRPIEEQSFDNYMTPKFEEQTGTLTLICKGNMSSYEQDGKVPWDSSKVKAIIIEEGITSIDNFVFRDCINLTDITIPNSVISIGTNAFSNCKNLKRVTCVENSTADNELLYPYDIEISYYGIAKIVFESNGGSVVGNHYVKIGEKITFLPTPEKPGYRFLGWYTDAELTKAFDEYMVITASVTLYAKYTEMHIIESQFRAESNRHTYINW